MLGAFTQALGINLEISGSEEDALVAGVGDGSLLMVIDNCEAAIAQTAPLVRKLLQKCSKVRIVIVSQKELGLRGVEHVFALGTMDIPPEGPFTLNRLKEFDCFCLFQDRAILRGWRPNEGDLACVGDVLRLTCGIPLAIEFVAAWAGAKTLTEIFEQLRDTPLTIGFPPHLRSGDQDEKEHESLARCLEYSLNQLGKYARRTFPCVGLFEDTFTESAFAAVCRIPLSEAQELLTRFRMASLLRRIVFHGHHRYSTHRFTRAYSLELLMHQRNKNAFRRHLVSYYCSFIENKGGPIYELRSSNILELESEWRNVFKAIQIAEELKQWKDVIRLSRRIGPYLHLRGLWFEREQLVLRVVNAPKGRYNDHNRGRAYHAMGLVQERWGKLEKAAKLYEKGMQFSRRAKDHQGIGMILNSIGNVHRSRCDFTEARHAYKRSLEAFMKAKGHPIGRGRPLKNLGVVSELQEAFPEAMGHFQNALDLFRRYNDQLGEGEVLVNVARLQCRSRKWSDASDALSRAGKIFDDYRDLVGQARCLRAWGIFYSSQMNYREAIRAFGKSQEIYRQLGDFASEGATLFEIAKISLEGGYRVSAMKRAKTARKLLVDFSDKRIIQQIDDWLAARGAGSSDFSI